MLASFNMATIGLGIWNPRPDATACVICRWTDCGNTTCGVSKPTVLERYQNHPTDVATGAEHRQGSMVGCPEEVFG